MDINFEETVKNNFIYDDESKNTDSYELGVMVEKLDTQTDVTDKGENDTLDFIEQKLQICVDALMIHDNSEAIQKLTDYIINPHKIVELINEDDIFNLFIEKFGKTIK